MLKDFLKYARQEGLFKKGDRILLAVSGGVDSVVMANLFWEAGFDIGIAHCNFQLRGAASDADAAFVENLARELEAPFHLVLFETARTASEQGISIQMAARQLRYEWLDMQRSSGNYAAIATAHHLDDSIETLFFNFAKGCGLHGLHGIPVRQGNVIRPMLFAHKEEIRRFAETGEILCREDQSNSEDKYARNHIRHQVIPAMKALNPSFSETAAANIRRLQEAEQLMNWAVAQLKTTLTTTDDSGKLWIDYARLKQQEAAQTLLYEWLKPYGFHASSLARLLTDKIRPGAIIHSPTHRLLLDRDALVLDVQPDKAGEEETFQILADTTDVMLPDGRFDIQAVPPPDTFGTDKNTAYLNLTPADFPLHLRHWRHGDVFHPLGMQGKRQKVQDFFSNLKLSRFDKSGIWLLETADGRICWIVGLRDDERFRVTKSVARCIRIVWSPAAP